MGAEAIDRRDRAKRTLESLAQSHAGPNGYCIEGWCAGMVNLLGGAGAAVVRDKLTRNSRRGTISDKVYSGGAKCTLFRAHTMALRSAAELCMNLCVLQDGRLNGRSILICCSSREVVKTLAAGPLAQKTFVHSDIWKSLLTAVTYSDVASVIVQWIPPLSPDLFI